MPAAFSDLLFINPMDTPKIAQNASEYDEAVYEEDLEAAIVQASGTNDDRVCLLRGRLYLGAKNNKDYTPELLRVKEMILNYMKVNVWKKEIHSICEQVLWILFYDAIS